MMYLQILASLCQNSHYIDGKEFLTLTDKEIKTMVPPIGLALRLVSPDKEVDMCMHRWHVSGQ